MKKQFFAAAMILALGAGFTACSSDDLNVKSTAENAGQRLENRTYMSLVFNVAGLDNTRDARAAGDGSTQDDQDNATPPYNNVGKWKGIDKIASVSYYIFDGTTGAALLEKSNTLGTTDWTVDGTGSSLKITPKKAIDVKPGQKTVFVVVNPSANVTNLLPTTAGTTLAAFKAKYESSDLVFAAGTATTTVAEQIAKFTAATTGGTPSAASDEIMMTGEPASQNISAGITEAQTIPTAAGTTAQNRVSLTVQRAVARVLVTKSKDSYVIKGDNPTTDAVDETELVKITKVVFSEAQGENKIYFIPKAATATGTSFQTPGFAFKPASATDFNGTYTAPTATLGADKYYDYSGLQKPRNVDTYTAGKLTGTTLEEITKHHGAFILPNTHEWSADLASSGYRRGNTAYVLVRAYASPKYVATAYNADTKTFTWTENWTNGKSNATVCLGEDGFFYATDALAQNAAQKRKNDPTATQNVKTYTVTSDGVKMLYWAWLNPNTIASASWASSPVIRNNVYHIAIKDFTHVGENWNNLVPNRPNDPNNPKNPDPKPGDGGHEDPNTNPGGGPDTPLGTPNTYMSVDATILPWQVHSYEISF